MDLPQTLRLELLFGEVRPHDLLQFLQGVGGRLLPPAGFGRRPKMDVTDDSGIALGKLQELGDDIFVQAADDDG